MTSYIGQFFGYINVETPKYELLPPRSTEGGKVYELRRYEPTIRAQVTLEGPKATSYEEFSILAGYIFGKNKQRHQPEEGKDTAENIAMTAPVLIDQETLPKSETIAMAAPVLTEGASGTDSSKKMTMAFILPSKYKSLDQLPLPVDPRVELVPVPAYTAAVIRFSGSFRSNEDEGVKAKEKELREALEKDNVTIKASASPVFAGYNPPWTPSFWRTNEIQISVDMAEK